MSAFKNYFDGIDTKANTSAECGEIRSKAAKIKKRRKAAASAVGVTLAVMMTTTVAVSAAGGWNITEIIGRWFKGNTASITDNLSVVTAENAENEFEFLDIAPNGAVIDDNMIIFFIDVTRNDGNIFNCEEYAMTTTDGSFAYDSDGEKIMDIPQHYFNSMDLKFALNITEENGFNYDAEYETAVRQYLVDDGSSSDNKITIAFCCDRAALESQLGEKCYTVFGTEVVDISDVKRCEFKSVKLNVGSLTNRTDFVLSQSKVDGHYNFAGCSTEKIDGSWNGELMFDIKPTKSVTIEPNKSSTFEVRPTGGNEDVVPEKYDYSFNVDKITLSQMSVSFDISAEAPELGSYIETHKIGEIIMKNGDTVTIQPYTLVPCMYHETGNVNAILPPEQRRTKWEIGASVMLTEPIDPDEVEAVRLGDTTFPIE